MNYQQRKQQLFERHEALLTQANEPEECGNGIYERYRHPILTAGHTPLQWRYDFSEHDNPYLMQRIMINSVFNAGAIKLDGRYLLVCRVEGADRKSFFAVAESPNGIDNFRFWHQPIIMPEATTPATNIYDMRVTRHEDGWIYGIFCAERHDDSQPHNPCAATATAGIARTKDLIHWERLPDLISQSQQRNVVLHPEFVYTDEKGKIVNSKSSNSKRHYALYTRPQDGFIDTGTGGGIGWSLIDDITHAEVGHEVIISPRCYHTIAESKNGEGPSPLKTPHGWLHLAHGVRGTASGLRYVLYMYMTALDNPTRVIAQPGGYFLAPTAGEYIGDVMNVCFSNGWILDDDGRVLIYYASSDTRMHVAVSSIDRLVDYCINTPADNHTSAASVGNILQLINKNHGTLK